MLISNGATDMCNDLNCNHDALDDDLSVLFGTDPFEPTVVDGTLAEAQVANTRRFETTCSKCRGSGRFVGYTGRVLGNCFTCKGSGVILTKTDPAVLAANRTKAADKKAQVALTAAQSAKAWLDANPAEAEWLADAAGRGFEFAVSLREALFKYGHLTERQEASVRSATAKSLARRAHWAAEKAEREGNKAEVAIDRVAKAFADAKASGLKWPKLRLDTVELSLASESGRNAGAIYVKDAAEGTYLGKIVEGRFTRSRDCDADAEARIVAACADPHAAAVAYGKRTGVCSCCGRELTNELSVSLGIGPICREKWGW